MCGVFLLPLLFTQGVKGLSFFWVVQMENFLTSMKCIFSLPYFTAHLFCVYQPHHHTTCCKCVYVQYFLNFGVLGKGKGLGVCVWISNSPYCVVESKSKLSLTSLVFSLQAFTCYWCCFVLTDWLLQSRRLQLRNPYLHFFPPDESVWKKEGMKWENGGRFKFHRNV